MIPVLLKVVCCGSQVCLSTLATTAIFPSRKHFAKMAFVHGHTPLRFLKRAACTIVYHPFVIYMAMPAG